MTGPPPRRLAALMLVALVHGLLLWWLLAQRAPSAPGSPAREVWTWLIPERPAPPLRRPPPASVGPRRHTDQPQRVPAQTDPGASLAITLPPPSSPEPAAPPAAVTAPDRAPLNLSLPPRAASQPMASLRNPALDDPRANTPRLSFGERMARDLGSDPALREERLSATTLRVRRGSECYELRQARSAQLDPFNGNMTARPSTVEKCR